MCWLMVLALCACSAVASSFDYLENPNYSPKIYPRVKYMRDLQSTMADADGKPKNLSSPTSVFCIPDYDLVNDNMRVEPVAEERCCSIHTFTFDLHPDHVKNLLLVKSYIMIFLEMWNNDVYAAESVLVNVSAAVRLMEKSSYDAGQISNQSATAWDLVTTIEVEPESQHFFEVDIRKQLATVWNSDQMGGLIDMQLKFDVGCDIEDDEMPTIKLSNPATLRFRDPRRRNMLATQPFLVIFADNVAMRERIESEYPQGNLPFSKERYERNVDTESDLNVCRLEDYTVNFAQVGFFSIIWPRSVNMRRCVGECTLDVIQTEKPSFSTYHARIVIATITKNLTSISPPCCSAVSFSPSYLSNYNFVTGALDIELHDEFIIEECGCR